jgi:hypothetical protein
VIQQHPITPPPELAAKWVAEIYDHPAVPLHSITLQLVERAAQWGADQELEACLRHLDAKGHHPTVLDALRTARRPKPPSLKKQALVALYAVATGANDIREQHQDFDTIRRALEQLDD